jgi:hypothetical protein
MSDAAPLFVTEEQLAHRLGCKPSDWKSHAPIFEREGLPAIDPLTGKRYWPAVRRWFDARHGLTAAHVPAAADGPEDWS